MNRTLTALTLAAAFTIPTVVAATSGYQGKSDAADYGQWEQMAFSDSCMNGGVSASGSYYSQDAENQSRASM